MKKSTKHLRKVRDQNIRAFKQKGLLGLTFVAETLGFPDTFGRTIMEIGSSSIIDPSGNITKLKMAMGLQLSTMDAVRAQCGDTDTSLYVGFQPSLKPTRVHPQLWLRRLAQAMPHIQEEVLYFVDRLFKELMRISRMVLDTSSPYPWLPE